jgi:hypothetical protein
MAVSAVRIRQSSAARSGRIFERSFSTRRRPATDIGKTMARSCLATTRTTARSSMPAAWAQPVAPDGLCRAARGQAGRTGAARVERVTARGIETRAVERRHARWKPASRYCNVPRAEGFTRQPRSSFRTHAMGRDKVGRNGIPKPAGAGGGSSSLSLEPFGVTARINHLEITLRLRPEGGSRVQAPLRSGASSSSKTSACRIASTSMRAPLSIWRNEGAFSTALASEIHDARIALFSSVDSFASFVTSQG